MFVCIYSGVRSLLENFIQTDLPVAKPSALRNMGYSHTDPNPFLIEILFLLETLIF